MGINNFNYRQCCRALKKIGFQIRGVRRGKHDKYYVPASILKNSLSTNSFIMIPRHKKLYCQNEIVNELRRLGGTNLVDEFRRYL